MLPPAYRDRHHTEFEYMGQVHLIAYELFQDRPSQFEFSLDPVAAVALSALETELVTHGVPLEDFVPDEEGRQRITQHVSYERSARNRARALAIHGSRCVVCGFSFDEFYGAEHAAGYIEMHHVASIAGGPSAPYIETELVPLCSNCHSMAHRRRGEPLSIPDLKRLLRQTSQT